MIYIPDSIFPKNNHGEAICPKCHKPVKHCVCPVESVKIEPAITPVKPKIRLETSGRHEKVVTLIEHLPADEIYLKDLAKTLKTRTGSGGTHYISEHGGVIEIQGDHKVDIQKIMSERKIDHV